MGNVKFVAFHLPALALNVELLHARLQGGARRLMGAAAPSTPATFPPDSPSTDLSDKQAL